MMNQGDNELRSRINDALLQLQNEGRITQLAQTYLDIHPDDIAPLPTPLPTTIPIPNPTPIHWSRLPRHQDTALMGWFLLLT